MSRDTVAELWAYFFRPDQLDPDDHDDVECWIEAQACVRGQASEDVAALLRSTVSASTSACRAAGRLVDHDDGKGAETRERIVREWFRLGAMPKRSRAGKIASRLGLDPDHVRRELRLAGAR